MITHTIVENQSSFHKTYSLHWTYPVRSSWHRYCRTRALFADLQPVTWYQAGWKINLLFMSWTDRNCPEQKHPDAEKLRLHITCKKTFKHDIFGKWCWVWPRFKIIVVLRFWCWVVCEFVCTLISRMCRSNFELRKGRGATFVCDSGLKWDMILAAPSHTQTLQQYCRLGCHCAIDPSSLTLHYSEKSKLKSFLFCSSASSFASTPLPLTLARGHPPVDGAIPAAFDTESALHPTAISWFCNKSRENTAAFWVYCTAVTSSDCTERSRLKDFSKTSRLIGE